MHHTSGRGKPLRAIRNFIHGVAVVIAFAVTTAHAQEIKVTLLGTGSPPAEMNRFGPSILVEAADLKFLFDAGRGALQRLNQLKVRWRDIDGLFLTHLHSDHVVGFPDLWLTGWLVPPGRDKPLMVRGPRGTEKMMSRLAEAFQFDIDMRIDDEKIAPEGAQLLVEDIRGGSVYEQNGVRITAFEVDHAPVKPAFGYRIDYAGRSVVLSGDTRVSQNLIRYATGVDLLVHEVAAPASLERMKIPPRRAKIIIAHHVTPEQAGVIFARTKPKLAVYSHIVPPNATEQDLIPQTRTTYAGPLELGEDLMVIEIGEKVIARRWTGK